MPRSGWLADAFLLLGATQRLVGDGPGAARSVDRAQEILDRCPTPEPWSRVRRTCASAGRTRAHATEFGEELSEREVVVLRLAADGLQQREIADQLFISYNTVKSHLKAAYRKLGVASREAAIGALRRWTSAPASDHPGEQPRGWSVLTVRSRTMPGWSSARSSSPESSTRVSARPSTA